MEIAGIPEIAEVDDVTASSLLARARELIEPLRSRAAKTEQLRLNNRYDRIPPGVRATEIDEAILQDLVRQEGASFERWRLRKTAAQAVLPLTSGFEVA